MSKQVETMIGKLVMEGYMVTYHGQTIYLHDNSGTEWAEIDTWEMSYTITIGDRTVERKTARGVLKALEVYV